jgi:hypothetical protein
MQVKSYKSYLHNQMANKWISLHFYKYLDFLAKLIVKNHYNNYFKFLIRHIVELLVCNNLLKFVKKLVKDLVKLKYNKWYNLQIRMEMVELIMRNLFRLLPKSIQLFDLSLLYLFLSIFYLIFLGFLVYMDKYCSRMAKIGDIYISMFILVNMLIFDKPIK